MDKIQKFLLKLSKKERFILLKILSDIKTLNVNKYDVKPLKGSRGIFRLRKGKIRIIFRRMDSTGIVLDINYRKDIYRF